jgi:hypothetical protein
VLLVILLLVATNETNLPVVVILFDDSQQPIMIDSISIWMTMIMVVVASSFGFYCTDCVTVGWMVVCCADIIIVIFVTVSLFCFVFHRADPHYP